MTLLVRQAVVETLKLDVSKVQWIDTRETLGADSLDRLTVVLKLEERFQPEIPDERWEQSYSVKDIVELIHDEQARRQVGG